MIISKRLLRAEIQRLDAVIENLSKGDEAKKIVAISKISGKGSASCYNEDFAARRECMTCGTLKLLIRSQ